MADIFDSSFEKVRFVDSEADSKFEKHFTDELKVNEDCSKVATEEKNFINNGAASGQKISFIEVRLVCLIDWDCVIAKGIDIAQHLSKK